MLKTPHVRAAAAVALIAVATLVAVAQRSPIPSEAFEPSHLPLDAATMEDPTIVALPSDEAAVPAIRPVARASASPKAPADAPEPDQYSIVTERPSRPVTVGPTPVVMLAAATAPPVIEQQVATAEPDFVTITGCLERRDDEFRLSETEGENAPRSRSWRTGFLRQRNRPVSVVDPFNRLGLAGHVGERVTATGMIVDGEMEIGTLRRVASSCDSAS